MFKTEKTLRPADDGFRMPAEWEHHSCCWMAWPHDEIAWRGRHAEIKEVIASLAQTISVYEPVRMLVPEQSLEEARKVCGAGIELIVQDLNDAWARDTLPSFLVGPGKNLAGTDWKFNGWGDMEYCNWDRDQHLAESLCRKLEIPCYKAPIFNEGGAVHVDGEGTVICTRNTLLNENRNSGKNEAEVAEILCRYLGAEKVIWLDEGYDQDETGGHIDVITAFAAPGKIMHLSCDDPADPNYSIFRENIRVLESSTDAMGRRLEVIRIPQPPARFEGDRRLAISYMNFYFANGAVILPVFGENTDSEVIQIFTRVFPDREIVPFKRAATIFHGGGGIHCVTQQQPAL